MSHEAPAERRGLRHPARPEGQGRRRARRQPRGPRARDAERAAEIDRGLDDVGLRLDDHIRHGLASARTQPFSFWDRAAARLVDAQARALAGTSAVSAARPSLARTGSTTSAVQLGGGTDIAGALAYCESKLVNPHDTILVLISDLFEGGLTEQLIKRCSSLVASGVQLIALLTLSDSGKPAYDHDNAAALAALGVPAFACRPDLFPDLMAAAIERRPLATWAAEHDIVTAAPVT